MTQPVTRGWAGKKIDPHADQDARRNQHGSHLRATGAKPLEVEIGEGFGMRRCGEEKTNEQAGEGAAEVRHGGILGGGGRARGERR